MLRRCGCLRHGPSGLAVFVPFAADLPKTIGIPTCAHCLPACLTSLHGSDMAHTPHTRPEMMDQDSRTNSAQEPRELPQTCTQHLCAVTYPVVHHCRRQISQHTMTSCTARHSPSYARRPVPGSHEGSPSQALLLHPHLMHFGRFSISTRSTHHSAEPRLLPSCHSLMATTSPMSPLSLRTGEVVRKGEHKVLLNPRWHHSTQTGKCKHVGICDKLQSGPNEKAI